MSRPLEDYGLIGDGETAGLVSRDGSLDWLCWPRFDSDACFAALLGRPDHGCWSFAGDDEQPVVAAGRRYVPGTLVLQTMLRVGGGLVRVNDFMPIRDRAPAMIRIVEGVEGTAGLTMAVRLRFDYGRMPPWIEPTPNGFVASIGPDLAVLHAPVPVTLEAATARASFDVSPGQRLAFVLQYGGSAAPAPDAIDAEAALRQTEAFWRDWSGRFDAAKTRWPEAVRRALITLKALVHRPTGGLLAAPTTSLPEVPGGQSNWDYRYCWLRDATFTLGALLNAGYREEAVQWRDWLLRAVAGAPDRMPIMYRVDGGRHVDEWTVAGLPGYRFATPVRVGNAAAGQFQVDVWGEVIDMLDLADRAGLPPSKQTSHLRAQLGRHLSRVWNEPGAGLWESRAEARHYTYSRVMAWVGMDRLLRAPGWAADAAMRDNLAAVRAQVHEEVCREGWNAGVGSFTQYYGGQQVDASLLLMPLVGFLPATDPRMAATIAAVARELDDGGLIRRMPATKPDGNEGAFLACSCWMADCLNLQGKPDEASAYLERVLSVANDLGLLAEEYDVTGRHLAGNFPQALTHLGVVNTALGLSGNVLQRGGG